MGLLPNKLEKQLQDFLNGVTGINQDYIVTQQLSFSGMPQDDFITSAYVRRAKADAEGLPDTYLCSGCGRTYNSRNEFVACMQDHVKDFMAGTPIDRLPEWEEQMLKNMPGSVRAYYYKNKKTGSHLDVSPENQE